MTGTRRDRFEGLYRDQNREAAEPTDHADRVADAELVRRALATLSEADREVLMLVAWEGLDPVSAAKAAGCSRATFAVRLHRARKRLDRALYTLEFPLTARNYDVLEIR